MGTTYGPGTQRLKTILKRQDPPRWGSEYIPATLATREEAPAVSQASALNSIVYGRSLHALSEPERDLLLFALFHPAVFEINEQRMLSMTPRRHPLDEHPTVRKAVRPSLRGTILIADELGLLDIHPKVRFTEEERAITLSSEGPFPYQGDILVFFSDGLGPAVVNWTVKVSHEDFERPAFGSRQHRASARATTEAVARHRIEAHYYQDAGIATIRITPKDWDRELRRNLVQLFTWQSRSHLVPVQLIPKITNYFRSCVGTEHLPIEIAIQLAARYGVHLNDVKVILYQAIWRRELRLDLFEPFLIDKPMLPERIDPIEKYSHWLKRG